MADWKAIREEYEAGGISLRQLAAKHNVSKSYLIEKRDKEGWNRPPNRPPTSIGASASGGENAIHVLRSVLPSPTNAVEGANLGINALVEYLRRHASEMDPGEHLKTSNALAQYNKIVINAPPEEEEEEEDLSGFTNEELQLYAELQERAKKRA